LLRAESTQFLERPAVEVAAKSISRNRPQFAAGDRLNHYSIMSLLGSGATADVYRAVDTKLNRDVAIKVLAPEFARDRDRVSRFHREAQVLASPIIHTLHRSTALRKPAEH
jgi:serine/threonine-protein kinase